MTSSHTIKMSYCKERKNLVGAVNFLAWKEKIDLNLIDNEVMDHIKGLITQPPKEYTQAHARFMKKEVRAERILIQSIKDSLLPCVSKLSTGKSIYDKLVELFSIGIAREVISLRKEIYKFKISREEGTFSYCMRICKIRY